MGAGDYNRPHGKKWTREDGRVSREAHKARVNARHDGLVVQQFAQDEARRFGLKVTGINYKGQESTERKYRDEIRDAKKRNKKNGSRGQTHNIEGQIRDLTRNTIIYNADTQSRQGEALKRRLEKQAGKGSVVDSKRQNTELGYKGFMVHVKGGGKRQGEVQVLSDKMIYAKEKPKIARALIGAKRYDEIRKQTGRAGGRGHYYYEKYRVEKDPKKKEYWKRQSQKYYANFT